MKLARRALAVLALGAALALGGCSTVPAGGAAPTATATADEAAPVPSRTDPWERFNRKVFAFNEAVDAAVIKPVALAYRAVLPEWLRTGLGNMLGNLGDVWSAANLLLQAKPQAALETGMRVATNTVFGLGGFLDVAEEAGLERRSAEDFGQTLGRWGVRSGPYLVLPLLGPSTLRDGAALVVDLQASPGNLAFKEPRDRNGATVLKIIDTRVNLLSAGRVLDEIALDKYVLLRDAYLSRRRSLIYDGEPPDEEPADAPAAPAAPAK